MTEWYYHEPIKRQNPANPDQKWTCLHCCGWWVAKPQSRCPGYPLMTYPIPDGVKTTAQLRKIGMKPAPNQEPVGCVRMGVRAEHVFYYYPVAEAIPLTEDEQAAIKAESKKNRAAARMRRICRVCEKLSPSRLPADRVCESCLYDAEAAQEVREYQALVRWAAAALTNPDGVILDCETTDLYGVMVELAIIDMAGTVLFHERFNPLMPIEPDAQRIHGIADADVAACLPFEKYLPSIRQVLKDKTVYVYNANFDRHILANELRRIPDAPRAIPGREWQCVMQNYAQYVGEWSYERDDYKWQKLPGGDHTAVGDCLATLAVLKTMAGIVEVAPVQIGEQLALMEEVVHAG